MSKSKNQIIKYASTPYTQVPDGLWICEEFNDLSAQARCIFMVALSKWNPYKPDKTFAMLYTELREITGFTFNTISKAIGRLILDGFLDRPIRGSYPHNVALYKVEKYWIERKYPKKKRPRPDKSWKMIREVALIRDGYRCIECDNTDNLHVHHLTYENEGNEKLEDLVTLCRGCHNKKPKRNKKVS